MAPWGTSRRTSDQTAAPSPPLSYRPSPAEQATGYVFEDVNGNEQLDVGEPRLCGIRVSNGVDIVRTDQTGRYAFEVDNDTLLFVIKPRGYRTPIDRLRLPRFYYIHKPQGSPPLQYAGVPANQLIVLMMHIPLDEVGNRDELYRLIEKRSFCISISAHHHRHTHRFITRDDGWQGAEPHHHIINVTVSGSWWTGAPNERRVPQTIMGDGAPNGYSIISFDGTEYALRFKAAGHPDDYQMDFFLPEEVVQSATSETLANVNVFHGSRRSTVEMRVGDMGNWQKMAKDVKIDPRAQAIFDAEQAVLKQYSQHKGNEDLPWIRLAAPKPSAHLWQAKLPPDMPVGTHVLHVRTTDMHGKTSHGKRLFRVVPSCGDDLPAAADRGKSTGRPRRRIRLSQASPRGFPSTTGINWRVRSATRLVDGSALGLGNHTSPWHNWIARRPPEPKVRGSNPLGDTRPLSPTSTKAAFCVFFGASLGCQLRSVLNLRFAALPPLCQSGFRIIRPMPYETRRARSCRAVTISSEPSRPEMTNLCGRLSTSTRHPTYLDKLVNLGWPSLLLRSPGLPTLVEHISRVSGVWGLEFGVSSVSGFWGIGCPH